MCKHPNYRKVLFYTLFFLSFSLFNNILSAQKWEDFSTLSAKLRSTQDISDFITINGIHYLVYTSHQESGTVIMQFKNNNWAQLAFFPNIYKLKLTVDKASNTPYIAFYEGRGKYKIQKLEGNQWVNLPPVAQPIANLKNLRILIENGTPHLSIETWLTESQSALMLLQLKDDHWEELGNSVAITKTLDYHIAIDQATPYLAFIDPKSNPKVNILKLENNTWEPLATLPNEPKNIQNLNFAVQKGHIAISYNTALIAQTTIIQQLENDTWLPPITIAHSSSYAAPQNLLLYQQNPIISHWSYNEDSQHSIELVYPNNTLKLGDVDAVVSCKLSLDQNNLYVAYKEQNTESAPVSTETNYTLKIIIKKQTLPSKPTPQTPTTIQQDFSISPNPVRNTLHLKTAKKVEALTILSMDGKILGTVQRSNKISTNQLPKGVYMLQINTAKGIVHKQFIKK